LYAAISEGKVHFLLDHPSFSQDMPLAIERLEQMMNSL
jgi:hypothetical protein